MVGFGFSDCEFRMYYFSTNNNKYSCKVRASSFQLVFCEPKYENGDSQVEVLEGSPLALG